MTSFSNANDTSTTVDAEDQKMTLSDQHLIEVAKLLVHDAVVVQSELRTIPVLILAASGISVTGVIVGWKHLTKTSRPRMRG